MSQDLADEQARARRFGPREHGRLLTALHGLRSMTADEASGPSLRVPRPWSSLVERRPAVTASAIRLGEQQPCLTMLRPSPDYGTPSLTAVKVS
jgi:hypothetical protein